MKRAAAKSNATTPSGATHAPICKQRSALCPIATGHAGTSCNAIQSNLIDQASQHAAIDIHNDEASSVFTGRHRTHFFKHIQLHLQFRRDGINLAAYPPCTAQARAGIEAQVIELPSNQSVTHVERRWTKAMDIVALPSSQRSIDKDTSLSGRVFRETHRGDFIKLRGERREFSRILLEAEHPSPREIDLISLLRVKRRRTQMPLFRGKTCSLTYSPEGKHDEKNNISEGENALFAWKCVFSPIASVLPAKEAVPCW